MQPPKNSKEELNNLDVIDSLMRTGQEGNVRNKRSAAYTAFGNLIDQTALLTLDRGNRDDYQKAFTVFTDKLTGAIMADLKEFNAQTTPLGKEGALAIPMTLGGRMARDAFKKAALASRTTEPTAQMVTPVVEAICKSARLNKAITSLVSERIGTPVELTQQDLLNLTQSGKGGGRLH